MSKINKLDVFGSLLVATTRDDTYEQFKKIMYGELNSRSAKILHEKLLKFDHSELKVIQTVVRDTIDSTIHHFLWMIDQNEEYDLISYLDEEKKSYVSLRDMSDGLCGELYTEDGWIEKYSKYPPSIK